MKPAGGVEELASSAAMQRCPLRLFLTSRAGLQSRAPATATMHQLIWVCMAEILHLHLHTEGIQVS